MSKILDILLSSQVRIKQEFDLLTQRINEINIVFVSKDLVFIFDGYTDLINNKSLCLFNNSTHKFDSHLLIEEIKKNIRRSEDIEEEESKYKSETNSNDSNKGGPSKKLDNSSLNLTDELIGRIVDVSYKSKGNEFNKSF